MTRNQIIIRPPSSNRRRPLLSSQRSTSSTLSSSKSISISSSSSSKHSSSSARFAEVAGGTTAECAVVCCCCPCGLMELLLLAIYKVPAGLCKRILKKRRRKRLLKKGLLPPLPSTYSSNKKRNFCGCDETEMYIHPMTAEKEREWIFINGFGGSGGEEKELMELEKEMWERFYSTGFWRSPSQREAIKSVSSAQGDMNQALSYCVPEKDSGLSMNECHQSINQRHIGMQGEEKCLKLIEK